MKKQFCFKKAYKFIWKKDSEPSSQNAWIQKRQHSHWKNNSVSKKLTNPYEKMPQNRFPKMPEAKKANTLIEKTILFQKSLQLHMKKWHRTLGAPERKRRDARSGSHDPIAGPHRRIKGWCFGVMHKHVCCMHFKGPRKTHPQVRQYVFKAFHCKGAGCVYISLENAFGGACLFGTQKHMSEKEEHYQDIVRPL